MSLLILLQALSSDSANTVFQKANAAYEKGRYEEARTKYETLVEAGWVSTELYYNLGNTYFKLKKNGLAILFYEKTLKLDSRQEDAWANLELARLRRRDTMIIPPDFFVFALLRGLRDYFSVSTWAWLSLIGWYLLIGLLVLPRMGWWVSPNWVRRGVAIVFLLLSVCFFSKWAHESNQQEAVILSSVADARNEPLEASSVVFVLHEGTKVQIRSEREDWLEIVLPDGKVGWVRHTDAGKI